MIDESSAPDLDQTEAEEFAAVDFEAENQDFDSSESEDIRAAERELESSEVEGEPEYSVMVLEEVDVALVLAVWEPTGDVQVDSALEQLATLDELSVHDHAEVLTSVHSSLHQRLTDISA
ncbi:MAG: hypothetical protein Q8L05_02455 [Actinomycetota bacterium]|nr:hypothetical protein [Actinomycetota bacterium]MDP2288464.1 hypothetical protein [Actinomycetota bacterium]